MITQLEKKDMKKDIPETPDFIHKMIQNEVAKQMQDTKVVDLRRRKRWTVPKVPKVAVVAAACILAVSTAVYAGVNLYHWFLEKQGSYGVSVKIDAGDAAKKTVLPDEVPEVDLSAKYVPEGMSWIDEYHLQYPEHDMTGGFSFSFVRCPSFSSSQIHHFIIRQLLCYLILNHIMDKIRCFGNIVFHIF